MWPCAVTSRRAARALRPTAALLVALLAPAGALQAAALGAAPFALASEAAIDAVQIAFLRARVSANPGDHAARLDLARALAVSGRPQEARALLDPLRTLDPEAAARAETLALQLDWQLYNASPPGSARRAQYLKSLREGLRRALRRDLPMMDFAQLADLALQLENPALAARFYAVLARREPERAAAWLARSARWMLGAGKPMEAAESYARAAIARSAGKRRSEYALDALDAALASGDPHQAFAMAERLLAEMPGLARLRLRAVQVAESVGEHGRALDWLAALSALPDASDHVLQRQRDLALAAGELSLASAAAVRLQRRHPEDRALRAELARLHEWRGEFRLALEQWRALALSGNGNRVTPRDARALQRAAELHAQLDETERAIELVRLYLEVNPDDYAQRTWLARMSEWGGVPREALAEWLWLAEHRGASSDFAEVERLAPMLHDHAAMARLWRLREGRETFDAGDYLALAEALQRSGDLRAEAAALQRGTRKHPRSEALWRERAEAAVRANRHRRALEVWRASEAALGPRDESVVARAQLLLGLGETAEAAVAARQIGDDPKLQALAGEIAWRHGDAAEAGRRYAALWGAGVRDAVTVDRHIALVRQRRGWRAANRLRVEAFRSLGQWHRMLNALADAQRDDDWDAVRELLQHASGSAELVAREDFWLLSAAAAEADDDSLGAQRAYARAVRINPDSEARPALLWLLIAQRQRAALEARLNDWRDSAANDRRLWPAYAAGLLQLGRPRDALHWYRKLAAEAADEPLWQLDFADALAAAGYRDSAFRVSRHALSLLGESGLLAASDGLDLRVAMVMEGQLGALAARHWVDAQQASVAADSSAALGLAEWYLRNGQLARTRHWLTERQRLRLQNPAWLEMALALASDDLERVDELLDSRGRELDVAQKVQAQRRLGRVGLALDTALGGLAETGDPALREAAVALRSERPNDLTLSADRQWLDDLHVDGRQIDLRLSGDHGTFSATAREAELVARTPELAALAGEESLFDLGYRWDSRFGESRVGLGARRTLGELDPRWELGHAVQISAHWRAEASLASGRIGVDSEALRALAGSRGLRFDIGGRFGARNYLDLSAATRRLYALDGGARLGDGWTLDAEVGRHFGGRVWTLRAGITAGWLGNRVTDTLPQSFDAALPGALPEDVIPERFSTLGVRLRAARGEPLADYPQVASPRYFAELWLGLRGDTANPLDGEAAGLLSLGVAGAVFGGDELGAALNMDSEGVTQSGQLRLWYRRPFD